MSTSSRKSNNEAAEDHIDGFRPFPIYVILGSAIVIIAIGLFLIVKGQIASGTSMPGRSGLGGGQSMVISGPSLIGIGVLLAVYPLIELFQRARRRKCA